MNKKIQTVRTYDKSAKEFAKKFDIIGARIPDIEKAFALINKKNPKVFEIGCGNGRDAKEIIKKTNVYLGIDISKEFVKLAKEKVPQANFRIGDVSTFEFPKNLDIVFSFASLLHTPKDEFRIILNKIHNSLNRDGIVYISLKHSYKYKEVIQEDEFGIRTFYYYSQEDIKELAKNFIILKCQILEGNKVKWLEIILKK